MSAQVHAPGRSVRGILNSDDISTAAPVVLYDNPTPGTAPAAYTMQPGDILIVYLISVSNGATAGTIEVFDDADADGAVDAGETLFKKAYVAGESGGLALVRGFPLTRVPKVKASAGSVGTSVVIYGEVQQAASNPLITRRI